MRDRKLNKKIDKYINAILFIVALVLIWITVSCTDKDAPTQQVGINGTWKGSVDYPTLMNGSQVLQWGSTRYELTLSSNGQVVSGGGVSQRSDKKAAEAIAWSLPEPVKVEQISPTQYNVELKLIYTGSGGVYSILKATLSGNELKGAIYTDADKKVGDILFLRI